MSTVSPVGSSSVAAGSPALGVVASSMSTAATPRDLSVSVAAIAVPLPLSWECSNPADANVVRALPAAHAVVGYADRIGAADDDLRTAIADLVADLRHLADAVGVDWDDVSATADRDYSCEVEGDIEPASENPVVNPEVPDAVLARAEELFARAVADHHTRAAWADVDQWERRMWIGVAEAESCQ